MFKFRVFGGFVQDGQKLGNIAGKSRFWGRKAPTDRFPAQIFIVLPSRRPVAAIIGNIRGITRFYARNSSLLFAVAPPHIHFYRISEFEHRRSADRPHGGLNMDQKQTNAASNQASDAAACGRYAALHGSVPYPPVDDLLATAKTCRAMARMIEEGTEGRPIYRWLWYSESIKALRWVAEKAQDTAEYLAQNDSLQPRENRASDFRVGWKRLFGTVSIPA